MATPLRKPPPHQLWPEVFEPFLERHPSDFRHRDAALKWYYLYAPDTDALKAHTRAAIHWQPQCFNIYQSNLHLFDLETDYLAEVREGLEGAQGFTRWRSPPRGRGGVSDPVALQLVEA